MLNERQLQIIKEFKKEMPNFVSSEHFVQRFGVSTRTIQSDIKKIKTFLDEAGFAELSSVSSKGSKLQVKDPAQFQEFLGEQGGNNQSQTDRVQQLCVLLLNQRSPLTRVKLADKLYVSLSTLDSDLKAANKLFAEYHIQIKAKRNQGIIIAGNEYDKRKCLLKLGFFDMNHKEKDSSAEIIVRGEIEKTLVSTLLKYHYHVSETLFQNLVVHIEMSIQRMQKGFHIQSTEMEHVPDLDKEIEVAKEIFDLIGERTSFKFNDAEMINLAIYIKGKSDYERDDYISEEVNAFILKCLLEINEKFDIDLSQEIDLRLSLALHLMPLLTRIQFDIQNDNQMLEEIKLSFPLAFDIAAFMSLRLQEMTNKKVQEGEISYLAIYFNQYLSKYHDISGKKRILIITSLKRSESILLRQRFATWFPNEVSILTLANSNELTEIDPEKYDVIFTTEQTKFSDAIGAILISYYPREAEYSKIKLAIDGFKDKLEIVDLFSEELFFYGKFADKAAILDRICQNSNVKVQDKAELLRAAVLQREELGSSYFGNRIALPHPINPIMAETFVSVILLEDDVLWDADGNKVRLVMLVAIERNNAKVFQLWNYLATVIQDHHFVSRLLKEPTFENFKENLTQVLEGYI